MTGDDLHILLIEDNPGDARLIEEMLKDADELSHRIDPESSEGRTPTVHHETRLEGGLAHLESSPVEVILLDLHLPDSAGLETLAAVADAADRTPIVVLTGMADQETGVRAIKRGAQDYLVKDEVTATLLIRTIHHAIERSRQERERTRRREQLESLNRLNRISQDVTHLVITTATREELERRVCERLAESDAYRFAWIGAIERAGSEVRPRAAAGIEEGYLENVTITVDDSETARGPAGRAFQTHEVQVMQDVHNDPEFEPWREQAIERGYQSSAAVPIVHDDLLYGVLNVYASSPNTFSEPEREILSRLGNVVGHAIAAIERKETLLSDTVVELEFRIANVAEPLVALTADGKCTVRLEKLIRNDESLLVYGSADAQPRDRFEDALEAVDWIEEIRFLTPSEGRYEFEARTTADVELFDVIVTHGGRIESIELADGEFRLVVELSSSADARRLIEAVEETHPGSDHIAKRTVERSGTDGPDRHELLEEGLTEKQRSAIETAFFAGYFDWPRDSTGEEIAERLGISPATFNQHLRTAERKFFESVFES